MFHQYKKKLKASMKLHRVGCFQMEAERTAIWKIVFRVAVDLWKIGICI